MPSPSSIDSPLHLDLDPLMQRLVALINANDSLAHIQCNVVLYFWSHLVASLSANQLKKYFISFPKRPLMVMQRGVKLACLSSQLHCTSASLPFLLKVEQHQVSCMDRQDGASELMTRISNTAIDCGFQTLLALISPMRASCDGSEPAYLTTGSFTV